MDSLSGGASLPVLNHRFRPQAEFLSSPESRYTLLPFRFIALDRKRSVLTNLAGEYAVLPHETLQEFVRHRLAIHSPVYNELKSKHFLLDGESTVGLDLLAVKYRTKQSFVSSFTSLFMFVVSLRCDHSCPYCQVSRQSTDRHAFDMSIETAERAIAFLFRSPSQALKVEFQGGESLLNFDLIRHIVLRVKAQNVIAERNVQFVIATNLAFLSDEILDFCRVHDVLFSTSLDGPASLHNRNRPRPGGDSHRKAVEGILRIRERVGSHSVAALMTTTEASLDQPEAIIDEYVAQGFSSIFLRPLSPYGFAVKTGMAASYETDRWLAFYKRGLAYILELNRHGSIFAEEYSSMILRKILTPYPTGYVDLQSPAGIGISGLVFNYDGDIYASDESRMLAETGDKTFRLGNLHQDTFESVMTSETLLSTLESTMTEGMPMCSDCGFLPYCGSDPVYHHATQQDQVGHKPTSGFCRKNMEVIRHLLMLLEDDPSASAILRSWV
jgi:His-Xaa-Ser system radical SAM maturase HxsB